LVNRHAKAVPAVTIHAITGLRLAAAVAAALAAFLLLASSALASKTVVGSFGAATADYKGNEFNTPRGVAVNQSGNGVPAGTTYVVDSFHFRIQRFSPGGEFVSLWGWGVKNSEPEFQFCTVASTCKNGLFGYAAGQFRTPQDIAVDQATGNVFVSDSGAKRINIFSAKGVFQGAFGWGVRTGAPALEFCTMVSECIDGSSSQFGTNLNGIATDPAGNLYVANRTKRRVEVFRPLLSEGAVTGVEWLRSFGWGAATGAAEFQVCTVSPCGGPAGTGTGLGQFASNSPTDVAVDSGGNVYALDAGNRRVQKFSSVPAPLTKEFGAAALASVFNNGATKGTLHSLAVEPGTDHLLVAGSRAAAENLVAVEETTPEGAHLDTHGTDLTTPSVGGIGVAAESLGGNIYVPSITSPSYVYVLNAGVPTIEAPTGVGSTGATFHGEVTSNGFEVGYRFEYSSDGVTWTRTPQPAATLPAQPGSAAVEFTATDLEPNTEYLLRLASERPTGSWALRSEVIAFATSKAPPTIEDTIATQVTATGVRLVGYLDPESDATSYFFEYGTSLAYGQTVPVPSASAGNGAGRVIVSRLVSGLIPSTTYHFRIVASNSMGQVSGPDVTFTTRASGPGPQGRAFEMVSQADKGGVDVSDVTADDGFIQPASNLSGEAVVFTSSGALPGTHSNGVITTYIAERSAEGWSTDYISPPLGANESTAWTPFRSFSDDFSRAVFVSAADPQYAPGASEGTWNLYLLDRTTEAYSLLTPGSPAHFVGLHADAVGRSTDMSHVVISVESVSLLEEAPAAYPGVLYDWDAATGTLALVARMPGSNAPMSGASLLGSTLSGANAVSEDGSHIFYAPPSWESESELYVRIDGSSTQSVSKSQATSLDPNGHRSPRFGHAASDGSVAFFTSAEKLTDDATTGPFSSGNDIYRYDVVTEELTDITVDGADENGAEVLAVLGGSDDGTRLYFVAKGVLAPGATAGQTNLYAWTDDGSAKGTVDFIVSGIDSVNWTGEFKPGAPMTKVPVRVTPDGDSLLFQSSSKLTTYPNEGHLEVYLYDAANEDLKCASCNPQGFPASADAEAVGTGDRPQQARTLSADGRRVFFNTTEELVAEDVDSVRDVYEYDGANGEVRLVSHGPGGYPASFSDAGADGRDVFFLTRERLVAIDQDDNLDVYDARIGGGIASQNPPLAIPPCVGQECLAPTPPAPPAQAPASSAVQGPGNQAQAHKRHKKKRCKQMKKKQRKRCENKRHGRR
jgi:hypothetical protein